MQEFRKQWTWPTGLGDAVYVRVLRWSKAYANGKIHKSRRIPHERYGEEMPDTEVLMRVHTLSLTYTEMKWLAGILQTEDPNNTQSMIFAQALKQFEEKQATGRAPTGIRLPFDFALTLDEVNYIRMLLEAIGVYRRPTPSEIARQAEIDKEGIVKADW